jgi:hypothetical protein
MLPALHEQPVVLVISVLVQGGAVPLCIPSGADLVTYGRLFQGGR